MKLDFQTLTLHHAHQLRGFFDGGKTRLCDQTRGGVMMWRNCFQTQVAIEDDCLYFRSEHLPGQWAFSPPMGDLLKGVRRLQEHCKETGEELVFCSVGEKEKDQILSLLPSSQALPTRDWFDYLYLSENLKTFAGKKLAGQRNHRNYFLKNHPQWHFEKVSEENLSLVKDFLQQYYANTEKSSPYFNEEKNAVMEVLENLNVYGFFGGILFVEKKAVAVSFGEQIGDTVFVHIEKANREVRGAYQMIVSEFLKHFASDSCVYVNREEDVGDPGLRYSKESYHPHCLLEKYSIR